MTIDVIMPKMEMAQETGTVVRWLKAEGSTVQKGEPFLEIETDKVIIEVEAPGSGILTEVTAHAGDEVPVGRVIAKLASAEEIKQTPKPTPVSATPIAQRMATEHDVNLSQIPVEGRRIGKQDVEAYLAQRVVTPVNVRLTPASPLARRLASEAGVNVSQIDGSGPHGAVLAADVRACRDTKHATETSILDVAPYRAIPLQGVRKVIAERLQHSFQTAPHIALTLSVDTTELRRLLDHLAEPVKEETGSKLSLTAVLVRITALALTHHRRLNAHLIDQEIREFAGVHIGVGVALDEGLIAPVIRDAQAKGLSTIQSELVDLAHRARSGKLELQEIKGSTFTISNLGMFGIEQFTAILNPPEVGLLAVGAIRPEMVDIDDKVTTRPVMRLTLIADHRAVDGAVGAQFLATLKTMLENPYRLLT